MSSAIYIFPKEPIAIKDWQDFCTSEGIAHDGWVGGGNYFYYGGKYGVEIKFGSSAESGDKTPPSLAEKVVVSTFFMGSARPDVVMISQKILHRFPGRYEADEELEYSMVQKR